MLSNSFLKNLTKGTKRDISTTKNASLNVSVVGSDEFFAALKEARRLRRDKRYAQAIAKFQEAIVMAQQAGAGASEAEVEVARTWWYQGRSEEAIDFCLTKLPDISAVKLLVSIWREEGHGAAKQGLNQLALERIELIEQLQKKFGFHLLTAKDRQLLTKCKMG